MTLTSRFGLSLAITALLGLITLLGGPARPAGAADAAKPAPCNGLHAVDPEGDAEYASGPQGFTTAPGTPNMDITGFFFNYRPGSDGKPVLTANIVLKNLDKTVPPDSDIGASGGVWYYAYYKQGDTVRFVRAANASGGDITYAHGTVEPNLGVYTTVGSTKGAFFEGPAGIVQIDIPQDVGGTVGEKLTGIFASVDTIEGQDDFFGVNHRADATAKEDGGDPSVAAPDAKDYTVEACAAPPSVKAPAASGAAGKPAAQGFSTLKFSAPSVLGSAAKASKQKSLTIKVRAGDPISNLKLALKPADGKSPAVASGSFKSVAKGTSSLKLKVTKKQLKPGKYVLFAQGTQGGSKLSTAQNATLKK